MTASAVNPRFGFAMVLQEPAAKQNSKQVLDENLVKYIDPAFNVLKANMQDSLHYNNNSASIAAAGVINAFMLRYDAMPREARDRFESQLTELVPAAAKVVPFSFQNSTRFNSNAFSSGAVLTSFAQPQARKERSPLDLLKSLMGR